MKKKCNVVIIDSPSLEGPILGNKNGKHIQYFDRTNWYNGNLTKRHLYITSNDEIKEDDYAILNNERIIKVGTNWSEQINKKSLKEYAFKIIATTDPELHKHGVAKIGLPFIEKYIDEYNKGNVIKEVNIEYCEYEDVPSYSFIAPRFRSDGTIIIHKIQEVFTKEDMEKAFICARHEMVSFDTWFEQNY